MKNVDVTSCSQSHCRPISRVTMSNITEVEKANSVRPHMTIRVTSSQSSAGHLRCRWRGRSSSRANAMAPDPEARPADRPAARLLRLLDRANQFHDPGRVRPQFGGEFVEIRLGDLHEAALVDVGDDFDADRGELGLRLLLQLESLGWFDSGDFIRRGLDPRLLFRREALPELVADPYQAVVGLVLGD